MVDIVGGRRDGGSVTELSPLSCFFGPDNVDGTSLGLQQKEGAQRPACRVVTLGFIPQADEELLCDLFSQCRVVRHSFDERMYRSSVPPKISASASGCSGPPRPPEKRHSFLFVVFPCLEFGPAFVFGWGDLASEAIGRV